jgi:hypothetical protein
MRVVSPAEGLLAVGVTVAVMNVDHDERVVPSEPNQSLTKRSSAFVALRV